MNVLVVCSGNFHNGISPLVKEQVDSIIIKGVQVEIFSINKSGLSGYFSAIPRLRKKIKEIRPDLIHVHYGLSGLVTFLTFTKCRIIISFMGDDLIGSVGKGNKYTFLSKILVIINKLLARNYYDYSITKSKELNEILSKVKHKEILPNGVNFNVFYNQPFDLCREKLNISQEELIVLFAANPLRAEKNYLLANEAISLIGKKQLKLFTVFSEEQNMLNYCYNAADVLLLTSLHEGSPNVVKEAMACGCPIVSTRVGDVAEVMANTDGCYIADFNPESISRYVVKAIEFRRLHKKTNGRDRLIQLKLDSVSVAEKLIVIYKKTINNKE